MLDFLTETKKPKNNGMVGRQGPGLSITSTDSRGYNALHAISASGDIVIFQEVMNKLGKAVCLTLLKQRAAAKSQGSPLAVLYRALEASDRCGEQFVDLLLSVKSSIGVNEFKKIPFEYF